jgi:hypothetical protein
MFIVSYPLGTVALHIPHKLIELMIAVVMAFVNNFVEMRVMAWKLCQLLRRPEPLSSEGTFLISMPSATRCYIGSIDIGKWQHILEVMTLAAILTNPALIAFTGTGTFTQGCVAVPNLRVRGNERWVTGTDGDDRSAGP